MAEPMAKRPRGRPKGSSKKVSKLVKDPNAPKRPATAYLLFCQEQRDKMKQRYPNLNFSELTRELGYKWSEMPDEHKRRYIETAERQRERYLREFDDYQRSEAYKQFMKSKFEVEMQRETILQVQQHDKGSDTEVPPFIMPLEQGSSKEDTKACGREETLSSSSMFTQEFLDHTRALDEELKQLQLTSSELMESNSLLRRHVEDLKLNVKTMEEDIAEQQAKNEVLRSHLNSVKTELVAVLQSIPLRSFPHALDTSNVESYLHELKLLWQKEPEEYDLVVRRVKEVILGSSQAI